MHPKYWKRHVLREEAGEGSAGGGALDMHSAAMSFPLVSATAGEERNGEQQQGAQGATEETPEQAAERLAAEEAQAAENAANGDGEQNAGPGKFTIKVDGKDVVLTADEMAEHYKNGLRQADYTRKTMEAAEARKAADAEAQKAKNERDGYAQKLQHFAIQANGELQTLAKSLTEELLTNDPVEYLRQERIFKERQAQLSQAQQELQQIGEQQQQEQQEAAKAFLMHQRDILADKLPEWKDPAKMKAGMDALEPFLMERGFSAQDGQIVLDARLLLLANDAMKYQNLLAKAKDAVKKVSAAPVKVEKPGNGVAPTDGRTRAMKQLEASGGSLHAAASVFSQFL